MSSGLCGASPSSFSPCRSVFSSSEYLQGLVDDWCFRSGRPLFGPRPEHVCDRDCVVLGLWPHQVCALSRIEHHCGGLGTGSVTSSFRPSCSSRPHGPALSSSVAVGSLGSGLGAFPRTTQSSGAFLVPSSLRSGGLSSRGAFGCRQCSHLVTTSEGSVCSFSGRVLSGPCEGVSTFGDSHWGSSVRRKSVSSVRSVDFSGEVQSGVEYFLSGSTRWGVWRQEKERLLGACVRSGKSQRPRYRGRSFSVASGTLISGEVPPTTSTACGGISGSPDSGDVPPHSGGPSASGGEVRATPGGLLEPSSPTVLSPPSPAAAALVSSESTHLFRESVLIVDGHFRKRRSSLSLPVRPSPWLRTLSEKILEWWKTVSRICPGIKRPSSSGVLPFVGTVLSFLGSPRGLVVGGVTLIRPSSRVRRHLPTARQMGLFGRLSCRKLSQCSRQLRSGLLTPSGGVRVVPCLEF